MKIYQSFAKLDKGNPYINKKKKDYLYLSFYSFILSYITLKKIYGSVTIFCNQEGYDSLIKYIPYDEIIFMENDNYPEMWSKYKIDCLRTINDDFIHVDSDIFINDDLFKPFLNENYDVIVQNILPRKLNFIKNFGFEQKDFLKNTKIFTKPYDGRCVSCGVIGLKKEIQEYYFKGIDVLYDAMKKIGINNIDKPAMLIEEQMLYFIAIENNFKIYEIIKENQIKSNNDIITVGDSIGYLHVWAGLKFKANIIRAIRKKLFYDYPEYLDYVIKFEQEVMKDKNIFKYMVLEHEN